MNLSSYTQALREDLLSAAALGDEDTRRSAAMLSAAIEPAARLAILNALSDFAAEVTGQLDDTSVEVRLDGRDVRVAVDHHHRARETADAQSPLGDPNNFSKAFAEASGDLSRTTVRMFNELKSQAEKAATDQGVSLNAFISRAVADSIRGPRRGRDARPGRTDRPRQSGSNITGHIQG